MPPKPKITREMIVDAGFEIARETGAENISIRAVAERLGCSTQPVMYHFKRAEELRRAVYRKADEFHSEYIMNFFSEEPLLDIGTLYIRFAASERHLFRFLFQSDEFGGKSLTELISSPELDPIVEMIARSEQVEADKAREIFRILFLAVHGCASLLANNSMEYENAADLRRIYRAAAAAVKEGL